MKLLKNDLKENPFLGIRISEDFYKIRLKITSKGKGKSGGGRVISYIKLKDTSEEENTLIILMRLYDKSSQTSIKVAELKQILEDFEDEE